jgi:hypothetical protein
MALFKKTVLAIAGIPIFLFGVFIWILPVIPGVPVMVLGLSMLLMWHPRGEEIVHKWKAWFIASWRRFGWTTSGDKKTVESFFSNGRSDE